MSSATALATRAPVGGSYTASSDPAAEARVAADAARLVAPLRRAVPELRALYMVGGYGRGEGGMLAAEEGPRPFNDYDLLALVEALRPWARSAARRRLAAAIPALEALAGVPVDVALQDRRGLRRVPLSILWYEMAAGHRLIWGDASFGFPRFDPRDLPLEEAILLLTNRGSSLLLRAVTRGRPGPPGAVTPEDATDAMKLVLAWGDALLLRARRYTVSYAERLVRLEALEGDTGPFAEELRRLYRRAVEFKLAPRPDRVSIADLARIHALHPAFLGWFEASRLGIPVSSWHDYASPRLRKLPSRGPSLRMAAKHGLRLGAPRDRANARLHARPTYERLASVLPLLLVPGDDPAGSERDWAEALRLLNGPAGAKGPELWLSAARRYLALWK